MRTHKPSQQSAEDKRRIIAARTRAAVMSRTDIGRCAAPVPLSAFAPTTSSPHSEETFSLPQLIHTPSKHENIHDAAPALTPAIQAAVASPPAEAKDQAMGVSHHVAELAQSASEDAALPASKIPEAPPRRSKAGSLVAFTTFAMEAGLPTEPGHFANTETESALRAWRESERQTIELLAPQIRRLTDENASLKSLVSFLSDEAPVGEVSQDVADLMVLMLRRLAVALHSAAPGSHLPAKAVELLKRHELIESPISFIGAQE